MAAYEVLLLNTAVPQIQAAQSGDTYVVPRDIAFSTVASFAAGTALLPSIARAGDLNTGFWFPAADTIAASTGGTERARIDSPGNLGLGVTPSAWGSEPALELRQAASLFGFSGTTNLLQNAFYDGSNWIYKNSAGAMLFQVGRDGHRWFTAPSGTAGNAITFTQAMTLNDSGNLLVGTTSGSSKLTVSGTNTNDGAGYWTASLLNTAAPAAGVGTGIAFSTNVGTFGATLCTVEGIKENATSDNYASALKFTTRANGGSLTERARITSGGDLLVGTTSAIASAKFNVVGDVADLLVRLRNSNASPGGLDIEYSGAAPNGAGNFFFLARDTGGNRFYVQSNGGIANYQGNDSNLSDRREKTNFAPAGDYLSKICAIPVQTFNYIDQNLEDDPGLTLGVVAQDVQAVAPELVMESNWGTKDEPKMRLSIYQTDLQYALMKCIQEQQAMINELKAEVAALKGN